MVEFVGLFICVPLWILLVLLLGASITAGLFVFHVAVVPLIFKYSKTFRRTLVFANFVQWPPFMDLEDPSSCGVEGGRNLTIEYHSKVDNCPVRIGIWHILPKAVYERLKGKFDDNSDKEELNRLLDDELTNSTTPIMIYCHGNSNSRGATHRIELYKFFQQMDFHTIAFDYRGYGDSTNLNPTEDGVVEDSLIVYEWVHNTISKEDRRVENKPAVCVWGHSLGTGISSHLLGNLDSLCSSVLERDTPLPLPRVLILEAPFNNLADEVAHHPLSKLVTWLPYYESTFVSAFHTDPHLRFKSDVHLTQQPHLPVLILHAKDDVIVPFRVGLKLYRSVKASRSPSDAVIKLHAYDKAMDLGHKWICHAPDLRDIVEDFVKNLR
ncbi:lysophosphatidylserine lipase ABHD12-like [Pectinophora gossypiella]|uniref:lysophosphatidylserine lipase ABHD12-like n=1 Tax=Pectinophora gossypiella TaxID=13191 RepID=UPI00214E3F07|nr:lysophosphatidylserine lipase ABHD12-like [Pectinophora gossypiella]